MHHKSAGTTFVAAVIAAVLTLSAIATGAGAQQRIALVVGNGSYHALPSLATPADDARLMAQTLRSVGFEVFELFDGDSQALRAAVRDFGRALRASGPADLGLFYFAGHALQANGENHLLATDSEISSETDLEFAALALGSVLEVMQAAGTETSLIVLDASRLNSLQGRLRPAGAWPGPRRRAML